MIHNIQEQNMYILEEDNITYIVIVTDIYDIKTTKVCNVYCLYSNKEYWFNIEILQQTIVRKVTGKEKKVYIDLLLGLDYLLA